MKLIVAFSVNVAIACFICFTVGLFVDFPITFENVGKTLAGLITFNILAYGLANAKK